MAQPFWQELLLSSGNEDQVWELFHENSKAGRYSHSLPKEEVRARMRQYHKSLPFEGYPIVDMPERLTPLRVSLEETITARVSALQIEPCPLTLQTVATLLHHAYGVTRDNKGTRFPRPFRVVPSAGALYPLEIFFHSASMQSLPAGLYHYNPAKRHLRVLRTADETRNIADALIQPHIALGAALIVFITAVFERSVFKYGDRGYRFVMLEAGHVAQNMNLVATALGLGSVNIGGFRDRDIDELLGLDGLTHSTVYMVAVGRNVEATDKDDSE